jgi:hypothetical protein
MIRPQAGSANRPAGAVYAAIPVRPEITVLCGPGPQPPGARISLAR